jgi:hypothetical protein
MSRTIRSGPLGLVLALGILAGAAAPAARAGDDGGGCAGGSCGGGPTHFGLLGCHCCKTHFYCTRPPCIHWHSVCLNPVCCPCSLEHYGYWETCWHPWPFPPDWSHCPCPHPSMFVPPPGVVVPGPSEGGGETAPAPRRSSVTPAGPAQ